MSRRSTPDSAGTRALILHEQRSIEAYLARQTVELPPGSRVWMVGPHPDDNVLGPGGTALKYVRAKIPVRWMCLTDGRACSADPEQRERLAKIRPEEERACARLLGIDPPVLLGVREDQLTRPDPTEFAIQSIQSELASHRPDALFVPWMLETHPLHRYTNYLVARALEEYRTDCLVFSWAAASFPPPRYVVDIEPVYQEKLALMKTYASQLQFRDYVADCELLGSLHGSYGRPPLRLGEAFFAQPKDEYIQDIFSRGLDQQDTLQCGQQPELPERP